jgi:serine/threonine-protein kinase
MDPDVNAPLPPGTRLGRYEIVRMLSLGGMGELYLAKTLGIEGFEKEFALKRILAQFATDPTFEHMLLDEARLMATLHHPNIVQVFDIDRKGGFAFFTMEYVHGENLRGVLKAAARKKRGLSRANAIWIVMNVAVGLYYAHCKRRPDGSPLGLIHRDVSPNNIMLSHEGGVKLVDFGVAMAIARSAKTTPGAIKGNVRYMSPEQSLGEPLDARSDIFSLGIVLFELTTGTRFQREKDDYWAVQKMLNEPLPRPSERKPDYPPELERIVLKALAKNPADRFSNAQEFQLALEEFARETKLPASSVSMARTMADLFGTEVAAPAAPRGTTPISVDVERVRDTELLGPRRRSRRNVRVGALQKADARLQTGRSCQIVMQLALPVRVGVHDVLVAQGLHILQPLIAKFH